MEIKHLIITLILLSFFTFPAIAEDAIVDFNTIIPMPTGIVAGSTYQTEYSFTGTISSNVQINFTVYHPDVNLNDWSVNYILNGNVTVPNEDYPGHFTKTLPIFAEEYNLIIIFQSVPNIAIGTYEFEVKLECDDIVIIIPDSDNGGSRKRSTYTATPTPTSTPTPTPTLTSTPIPTIIVQQVTTENATIIEIVTTPEEPTNYFWYIIITLLLLLAALITYILGKRKLKTVEEKQS